MKIKKLCYVFFRVSRKNTHNLLFSWCYPSMKEFPQNDNIKIIVFIIFSFMVHKIEDNLVYFSDHFQRKEKDFPVYLSFFMTDCLFFPKRGFYENKNRHITNYKFFYN